MDCFGDPEVIGKIGTDIQDKKCGWLIVQALKLCTDHQRQILEVKFLCAVRLRRTNCYPLLCALYLFSVWIRRFDWTVPNTCVIFQKNYGVDNPESIAVVKELYRSLGLQDVYRQYEEDSAIRIKELIKSCSGHLPESIFETFFNKIFKRKKWISKVLRCYDAIAGGASSFVSFDCFKFIPGALSHKTATGLKSRDITPCAIEFEISSLGQSGSGTRAGLFHKPNRRPEKAGLKYFRDQTAARQKPGGSSFHSLFTSRLLIFVVWEKRKKSEFWPPGTLTKNTILQFQDASSFREEFVCHPVAANSFENGKWTSSLSSSWRTVSRLEFAAIALLPLIFYALIYRGNGFILWKIVILISYWRKNG